MQKENEHLKSTRKGTKTEFLAAVDKLFNKITTKEEAIKFMQDLGVFNGEGKITKNYGGNE